MHHTILDTNVQLSRRGMHIEPEERERRDRLDEDDDEIPMWPRRLGEALHRGWGGVPERFLPVRTSTPRPPSGKA